ncbi:MAG: cupin domain-containing protein, partial [Candidatus Dormibacteraceae bacterium]
MPVERQNPDGIAAPETDSGTVPNLKFSFAAAHNRILSGGWAREVTARELPVAAALAGVNMRLEPGAMRELHWHPNADEWQYYLGGEGSMTVFASGGKARTFDYRAGDIGYVPFAMGHYILNTGEGRLTFLEMFRSSRFTDISLSQWTGLLPPQLVKDHLNLDDATIAALPREKPMIRRTIGTSSLREGGGPFP